MQNEREFGGKPGVTLDPSKLLGVRQVAAVSASNVGGANDTADGSAISRVDMSRLLSKNGVETSPTK